MSSYLRLRQEVERVFLRGRESIEQAKVKTYWETGRLINEHIRLNNGRAEFGKKVTIRLAKDLAVHDSVLRRCARFHELFPIRAGRHKLKWSHYRALITIEDNEKRLEWTKQAEAREWTGEELEEKIRGQKSLSVDASSEKPLPAESLLEPLKGKMGLYGIVKQDGALQIDFGFRIYEELAERNPTFKETDIVRISGKSGFVKAEGALAKDRYTYPVKVLKIIDADTFWMKIWICRPKWVKDKLRLRGIDAPELGTRAGERARDFAAALLRKASSIMVTTTKPDKWDRYLSDIFLTMPGGEEIFLNNLLLEKGLARPKSRFSFGDWEKE